MFHKVFFVICDCETGYSLDLVIYSGTSVDINTHDELGFPTAVVKKLIDQYYGGNHILYSDNYYTSLVLTRFLLEGHAVQSEHTGNIGPNLPIPRKKEK